MPLGSIHWTDFIYVILYSEIYANISPWLKIDKATSPSSHIIKSCLLLDSNGNIANSNSGMKNFLHYKELYPRKDEFNSYNHTVNKLEVG